MFWDLVPQIGEASHAQCGHRRSRRSDRRVRGRRIRHEPVPKGAAAKTSLVMSVRHTEGALLAALSVMHEHQINMTKLESRPRPGRPWEYFFYIDFEGDANSPAVSAMLDSLRRHTTECRVLGSYVSRTVSEGAPVSDDEIDRIEKAE